MQAACFEALPQGQCGDPALVTSPRSFVDTIAILQRQGVQNVLSRLIIALRNVKENQIAEHRPVQNSHLPEG